MKKKNTKNKRLKFFLVAIMLVSLGAISAIFIGYRLILNKESKFISSLNTKANLSISKVYQTATRDGIKEWSLEAKSAYYIDATKQANLKDVIVTFFLKDGGKVYLTADQGILKTDSNDIEVTGNVIVKNESYRLRTKKLNYEHTKRIIFSKVPVEIVGDSLNLTADSMSFDLNANRILFEGRIEGNFSESIAL
ncbi:MAG: LPS export ABC transporter periplasmic protein LptC [Desulfobacterales bacterium]|nr:LPS export ABC transporter periplasmic protein LptC [Desulfobacterales bacterium]